MKTTLVRKGEKYGFHQRTALEDQLHFRGTRQECLALKSDYARVSMHPVTGEGAPCDEWYGVATT